jgi:hypothetical protein
VNVVPEQFLAAALSPVATQVTVVEVWTGPSATVIPSKIVILGTAVALTWSEDETRSPRRQMSGTVESLGLSYDELVPVKFGDLLHPLTGNELRIFSGFRFSDGSQFLTPCGVYRMTKPGVVDTGDKIEITITGNDRSAEVDRRGWTVPYPITAGPTLDVAIHDLIDSRMPGLTYNLTPSTYNVPPITLGTQSSNGSGGPFSTDAVALATAGGMEVFFDSVGTVTLRPVPDPTTSPVVLEFTEGPTCQVIEFDRVLDETLTYNGVKASGTASGTAPPVSETVWVTDPASPLNPATFGYVPYYYSSPLLLTSAQCTAAATALLQTLLTAYDDTALAVAQNPALQCGDSIALARARIGLNDTYAASQISMSADVTTPMAVTNRARRSPA